MAAFEIRAARPDDNQALIALEKRSPLIVGETTLSFDRSPDYFAGARLQDRTLFAVATEHGAPIGVSASALHTTRLLGRSRLLSYTHHMRIDPAFQRHGVGRALGQWLRDRWVAWGAKPERGYAFIDAANTDSLAFAGSRGGPGPWPMEGWLHDLPAAPAAEVKAEPVGDDDLADVIVLLNRTHAGLELFPGYTQESLTARLRRSLRYGWSQWRGLRRNGRLVAVAGVLDQGESVAAITRNRRTGEQQMSRGMTVLDHGYSDVGAMRDLLVALRGEAAACERDALEISVPDSSPLFEDVQREASYTIRFKFLGGEHPPAGYPLRGVYIDPVYL
jgi:ribosomal protein S18 acetylase RimI-like enzyme